MMLFTLISLWSLDEKRKKKQEQQGSALASYPGSWGAPQEPGYEARFCLCWSVVVRANHRFIILDSLRTVNIALEELFHGQGIVDNLLGFGDMNGQ